MIKKILFIVTTVFITTLLFNTSLLVKNVAAHGTSNCYHGDGTQDNLPVDCGNDSYCSGLDEVNDWSRCFVDIDGTHHDCYYLRTETHLANASQCAPACIPDGSCNAELTCGQTTSGTDNCGNACSKTGPACTTAICTPGATQWNAANCQTETCNSDGTAWTQNTAGSDWGTEAAYIKNISGSLVTSSWCNCASAYSSSQTPPVTYNITNYPACFPPAINCSGSIDATTNPYKINWTSTITGGSGSYTYAWSSDNTSGTGSSWSHIYPTTGTQTATVTATDSNSVVSNTATCTKDITTTTLQDKPKVTTNNATSITQNSATLNSTINPKGTSTTGWFRYSATDPGTCNDSFGTKVPASGSSIGSDSTDHNFPQNITGLNAGTYYYFCALASNLNGTTPGDRVRSFLTIPDVTLSTSSTSTVTSASIISGDPVTLYWTVTGTATSCTPTSSGTPTITSGDWTSSKSVSGGNTSLTLTTATTADKTFNIQCSNGTDNSLLKTVTVTVSPVGTPPAPTISATPSCVTGGSYTATLSWSGTGYATGSCGTGFWVDIDNDTDWTNGFYHKCVSDPDRPTSAPGGFGAVNGATGTLTFQPDITYHARTYNGTQSAVASIGPISACGTASCSLSAAPTFGTGPFNSTITVTYASLASAPSSVSINCGNGTTTTAANCTGKSGSCPASCAYAKVASNTTYTAAASIGALTCTSAPITDNAPTGGGGGSTIGPWIQTVGGDVHSNTRIYTPGGP